MEQTVNQFNKGLQMDTHPMVQGTDTLSDALNATFVTMNGNEVILQNDMGNRKIDNAYLPSGYEPVGMKEYGGIIYVAAYNPLTNRGQLGSFPSPQRKLSTGNTEQNFFFSNFLNNPNPGESYKIAVDNITIPISDGLVLHTGDKFSVYSNEIRNIIQYLVPTESQGIKKNNLFSFQIGIFNSQNEFVDISDKLINQEINGYNYYITENSGIDQNQQSQNILNDQELLEARNSIAINTYSYKMSSPLYLRAKLNHVNSISYTIDGDIVRESRGTKDVDFYISVTYNYNCKDNINGNYFKLIFNGRQCSSLEEDPSSNLEFSPTYLVESDEYQVTLNYKVRVTNITSTTYNYKLEFPLLHDFDQFVDSNDDIIYPIQENLTQKNSIDIALLGSDTAIFSGYRYLFNNTSKLVTLELDIESYPKKVGSSYEIIPVIFYDQNHNYNLTPIQGEQGSSPTSGVYTITFNYEQLGLVERKLYHIKLQKHQDNNYDDLFGYDNQPGLFITTPIFNGNYIGSKAFEEGITLATINNEAGGYEYEVAKDNYIDNFLKIKYLLLNPIINVTTNQYSSKKEQEIIGQIINERSYQETTSTYDIKESYNITTKINPTISLNNIELYPKELESMFSIDNSNTPLNIQVVKREIDGNQVEKINGRYKYSTNLIETRGNYSPDKDVIILSESINATSQEITTTVEVHNFIKGNVIEAPILCKRVITSLYDFIIKNYFDNTGDYFNISDPYATIDFENGQSLAIVLTKGTIIDHTYNEEGIKFISSKHPQPEISNIFRQATENLLILEYSSNDYLLGCGPTYCGNSRGAQGMRKIWMRVSEKEYTPIFADSGTYSNEEFSTKVFYDSSDYFKKILNRIPHFYSYSDESKTIDRKVIDYHNLAATKEFNVSSNADVKISCNILLNYSGNYYKLANSSINTQINISEDNIESNNLIQDELNILSSLELDCVLESCPDYQNQMYSTQRVIVYRDREGNPFDPQYMYYLYNQLNFSSGFQKSYKADKFFISDLKCYFPELKDSSQLYHASNNKPHPYVNSGVFKDKNSRIADQLNSVGWNSILMFDSNKIGFDEHNYSLLDSKGLISFKKGFSSNVSYYSIPAYLVLKENNMVDCDNPFTMAQYEQGERKFDYAMFTSRNIFDQITIQNWKLWNWNGTDETNPMKDGWKPADDFISE